jgi:hypothetical protein
MKVPISSGIFSDQTGDFRTSYPLNLVPVAKDTGVSEAYLKPAEGLVNLTNLPGKDRGGISVNGECYRVTGTLFVKVTATNAVVVLGDVGGQGQVSLCYSFDNIGISSNGNLFYWNLTTLTLTRVTDPDLGVCKFVNWLDGYFVSTDGKYIVVTDLANPLNVNPLKYGSSEVIPDDITSLQVLRNTLYAVNRFSIEQFQNVGGSFFPFQRVDGAFIQRGAIGPYTCCVFEQQLAFLGSAQNEPPAIWLGLNAQTSKISTREIDIRLQKFTEAELFTVVIESRIDRDNRLLYIHLPNETLVYDAGTSQISGVPVWYSLSSSLNGVGPYQARNFVWAYDKWIFGDPVNNRLGTFNHAIGSHYGVPVGWEFSTHIIYNDGKGAIFFEMELICLTGNIENGALDPVIYTDYSLDNGVTWSMPKVRKAGKQGQREKHINWLSLGTMNARRIQRFRGNSDAHLSINALEVRLEKLYN